MSEIWTDYDAILANEISYFRDVLCEAGAVLTVFRAYTLTRGGRRLR
ncbi:MAG: hypothetical protein ACKESB_00930 [Candidatus Hodgkinia cicadicola]